MPPAHKLRKRVTSILRRLGLLSAERLEAVLALLDDKTPSGFSALARAGLPFSSGARTRQILSYIAPRLGKRVRMDRELRDSIMLPLREVGILIKGLALSAEGRVIPNEWKPKSPNNLYLLAPDFRTLLQVGDKDFSRAVSEWEEQAAARLLRIASSEAAAAAAGKKERLVPITLARYCPRFLPEYRVVFVDDADGRRIADEWVPFVKALDLPLNLASRWPDIILNLPSTRSCWVIDCVETDGEIDTVRKAEMLEAFRAKGLDITGFTTVYRLARRFAQRQSKVDNLAPGTYVWIAELGGAQFKKLGFVDA